MRPGVNDAAVVCCDDVNDAALIYCDDLTAFRCIMRYLHSDLVELAHEPVTEGNPAASLDSSNANSRGRRLGSLAVETLSLAGKYQLPRLQVACEQQISSSVCPDNASTLLVAADRAHALHLRQFCKAFIVRNFAQVRRSSGESIRLVCVYPPKIGTHMQCMRP